MYIYLVKSKEHALFYANISLYFLPLKIDLPNISKWKIKPAEKTSLMGSLLVVISLILMI